MFKNKLSLVLLAFLFSLIPVFGFAASSVSAQNDTQNSGLQISPTRTDLAVKPGESRIFKVTLKNVTNGTILVKTTINDFESNNETGEPSLIVDTSKRSERSIAPFVKPIADITLKSGETKEVQVEVDVPSNAAPGAYYGALRFAAIPESLIGNAEEERKISLTASVGSLVLLEVSGDFTQSMEIESMDVLLNGKPSSFFTNPPNQSAIVISNTGTGFAQPIGKVVVTKGNNEVYSYEFNSGNGSFRGNVLPGSKRTFTDDLKNIGSFGRYKITANLALREGGSTITATKSFWVVPIWMIVLVVLLFVALVVGIIYAFTKVRSHSRKK